MILFVCTINLQPFWPLFTSVSCSYENSADWPWFVNFLTLRGMCLHWSYAWELIMLHLVLLFVTSCDILEFVLVGWEILDLTSSCPWQHSQHPWVQVPGTCVTSLFIVGMSPWSRRCEKLGTVFLSQILNVTLFFWSGYGHVPSLDTIYFLSKFMLMHVSFKIRLLNLFKSIMLKWRWWKNSFSMQKA